MSVLVQSTNLSQAGKVWCICPGKGSGAVQGTSLFPGAHVGVDGHTVVGSIAEFLLAHLGAAEEGLGQTFLAP